MYSSQTLFKELKLPLSTNVLVCISSITYSCTSSLIPSNSVLQLMSAFGPICTAGFMAAALSSALASLTSGAKVLQVNWYKPNNYRYVHRHCVGIICFRIHTCSRRGMVRMMNHDRLLHSCTSLPPPPA